MASTIWRYRPTNEADAKAFKEAVREAQAVPKVSDLRGALNLLAMWGLIAGSGFAAVRTDFHWAVVLVGVVVVAKAQNSLLLLGHEAIHWMLFRNRKLNELTGAFLCFGPHGVAYLRARAAHLDHHRYLLTERDEKLNQQIEYPTRRKYILHLLLPLLGSYLWKGGLRYLGIHISRRTNPKLNYSAAEKRKDIATMILSTVALMAISLAIDWRLYLFLWVLPLFTVTAFFHNAKAFLDHARNPEEEEGLLYTYRTGWLDRLFFGVEQAHHAEHHLFPAVPYYRLPKLTKSIENLENVRFRGGYFGYLFKYFRSANAFRNEKAEN